MRFASLGSGSRGNGTVISADDTHLLLDCGFGYQETVKRLARLGLDPDMLSAVVVTHEHSDHWGGVESLASRHGIPVYATRGTWIEVAGHRLSQTHEVRGAFEVGSLSVTPVTVPHDAREPIQCVFEASGKRLGVLSDLGSVSAHVLSAFAELDALSVEFNHDWTLLHEGPYPSFLKKRVGGDFGHLNNEQARDLVAAVASERLQTVVACHVSETNNEVSRVEAALEQALAGHNAERRVASQSEGMEWITVGSK